MDIVTYALLKKSKADLVNGKVPESELPSYVDDVIEYEDINAFPEEGEAGKIYVALDTGFTYRWGGTEYFQIGGQDLSNYALLTQVFPAIDAPSSTTLTTAQYDAINAGCRINGTFLGVLNPILTSPFNSGTVRQGLIIASYGIGTYNLNSVTKQITGQFGINYGILLTGGRLSYVNGKSLPQYPSDDTKTYDFQQVNGSLQWTEHSGGGGGGGSSVIELTTSDLKTETSISTEDYAKLSSGNLETAPCVIKLNYGGDVYYTTRYTTLPSGGYWRYQIIISQYGALGNTGSYSAIIGIAKDRTLSHKEF